MKDEDEIEVEVEVTSELFCPDISLAAGSCGIGDLPPANLAEKKVEELEGVS